MMESPFITMHSIGQRAYRTTIDLNQGWLFARPGDRPSTVNLPHTWNAVDGQDGGSDYFRGVCHYRRTFAIPVFDPSSQRVYLEFLGVNASADVTLNGRHVIHHDGGYSTFRADVTNALEPCNELVVAVDNGVNDHVYPQMADFTFYGGIYRDVRLLIVPVSHFDLDYWGGNGVHIMPSVDGANGIVQVKTTYLIAGTRTNVSSRTTHTEDGDIQVEVRLLDADGAVVASGSGDDVTLTIHNVHLWDGVDDPYLYIAEVRLIRNGKTVDEVDTTFGVRSFRIDSRLGFLLNGRPYPLHAVARHQDRPSIGNALAERQHDEDIALIREMGANAVRLAHYQHDQRFYDLCDRYGLLVWAEIPYISAHMPNGRANTVGQMRELIVQNHHHPCIVVWGLSNEITIATRNRHDMLDNHRELNALCHALDPTRPTTLACHAQCPPTDAVAHITDVVGWNLYLGWYVPGMILNDLWIALFHWLYPSRALGYSEYGCEGMPNLHSPHPHRGDQTEEYQCLYHEYMLRCFERHPHLWITCVWNMFDFAADARDQGGDPGMNHKGLVSFDRTVKKDVFYLYKAYWSHEPFVHLCGRRYVNRAEAITTVKIYSNQRRVTLYVNDSLFGQSNGRHNAHGRIFEFRVPLSSTDDVRLVAVAGNCRDSIIVRRVRHPDSGYSLHRRHGSTRNWA